MEKVTKRSRQKQNVHDFTFCLDTKSNKKIKPGPKLSLLRRDRLWPGRPAHMENLLIWSLTTSLRWMF